MWLIRSTLRQNSVQALLRTSFWWFLSGFECFSSKLRVFSVLGAGYKNKIRQIVFPDSLRRYFCTQLVKKGVSIYIVNRILGHASVLVTQRIYCHLQDGDI